MRLTLVCFVTLLVAASVRIGLAENNDVRAVTVSATGTIETPPDQVVLTIGVTTEGNDLLETRRESDAELQAILKLGESHGVKPGDFRVTELEVSYGFDEDRRRFFYRVDREANMTLKEIARFDALLAAALKRGGFNITGIVFGTSKVESLETEARRRAVVAARAKAEQLAELNGLALGKARVISEDEYSHQSFAFSVSPAMAGRSPRRPGGVPSGAGMFCVADGEARPVSQMVTRPVSFSQPAASEGDETPPEANLGAAGLGVIETTVGVTIEFELILNAP